MTVVAFFDDLYIAIADILMSLDYSKSNRPLPASVFLPSAPHGYTVHPEAVPSRIVRKSFSVNTASSQGVFLGAGTVEHIKDVIQNTQLLRSGLLMPSRSLPTLDTHKVQHLMAHAMDISEQNSLVDFEILGLCDGVRFDRAATIGSSYEFPYFGKVTIAGSGREALRDWLFQRGEQISEMSMANEPFEMRRHRTGGWLISRLLEEDGADNPLTLPAGVGGYYELYEYDRSGMTPVDAVLTVFLSLGGHKNAGIFDLQNLFFHKYVDGHLCILTLQNVQRSIKIGDEIRVPLSDFSLSVVPRFYEKVSAPNIARELIVTMAGNADFFNLSLFRDSARDFPSQAKRFIDTQNKLLRTRVVDGNVHISFDYELLKQRFQHFPKRPAHGTQVFYSK